MLRSIELFSGITIGKKEICGRFVIPSGIRCTNASTIDWYFRNIDSIGIITTKSISLNPREGYKEPIYVQYSENSYINAVGLSNPGAKAFADELAGITVPDNKFLLVSVFGKDADEFLAAAKILEPYADGFELNLSCPHAKGYGLQIGHDADLAAEIVRVLSDNIEKPLIVKLSASIPNLTDLSKRAVENGADGFTVTNTIGPSLEYVDGRPALANVFGGLSGEGIRPLGIRCVREIREAVGSDLTIIGMGGIYSSEHIRGYANAGADFFGIGSALTNQDSQTAKLFLNSLQDDLQGLGVSPFKHDAVRNMRYGKCTVIENQRLTETLHKITLSRWDGWDQIQDTAGRFFFLMIPGVGEKPFAVLSLAERSFIIKNVGYFTNALTNLSAGDEVFIRGPYGKALPEFCGRTIYFVAGGTGISPVYEIACKYSLKNDVRFFLGGQTAGDIFDVEKFEMLGDVLISTDDGSRGHKGYVTELLCGFDFSSDKNPVFINCGPKAMLENCCEIERSIAKLHDIIVSIEYYTSCGVGICGKCCTETGLLSCVDGPFLCVEDALKIKA